MATFHLDKRTCLQKSILSTKDEWTEGKQELQTFYIDFYKKRKHNDREKSISVDVKDNVVVEPPHSSNIIDTDSEDSDSDLDNADIDDEHENLADIDEAEQAQIDALEAKQELKKVIKNGGRGIRTGRNSFQRRRLLL